MSDVASCTHCGCKHPWLHNVNAMAVRMKWECIECGTEQMTYFPEQDNE